MNELTLHIALALVRAIRVYTASAQYPGDCIYSVHLTYMVQCMVHVEFIVSTKCTCVCIYIEHCTFTVHLQYDQSTQSGRVRALTSCTANPL